MLQKFFGSINLLVIPTLFVTAEKYISDIKGLVRIGKRGGGGRRSSTYGVYQNAVGSARGISVGPPVDRRQCVVQWHLIRNNGPSSHILMVRGPYVLDGEHYIALEDPGRVANPHATPW